MSNRRRTKSGVSASNDEAAILEALRQQALKPGSQGRTAAARTYLEHTVGKPLPKPQDGKLDISDSTLRRVCDLAEKLTAKCMHCGLPIGAESPRPDKAPPDDDGGFQAFEQPAPPKGEPSPEPEPAVLHRQPRIAENPDPLRDHRGSFPE